MLPAGLRVRDVGHLVTVGHRKLLGIAGPPGSGKTTLAEQVATAVGAQHAVVVSMDGFHLAQAELVRLGRAERKGAPDTFDAEGFVALVERLKVAGPATIYAPVFHRDVEEPIAGACAVGGDVSLVVIEGNYLLLDDQPWNRLGSLFDETWYVDVDTVQRRDELIGRHVRFGRSLLAATEWVDRSDEVNAARVATARHRATYIVNRSADQGC